MNRKLLIILIVLISCRKEKDELVPRITIYSPVENNSYQLPHQLSVKGSVEDNASLEYITVDLITKNGTRIVPGKSVIISGNPQSFEFYFDLQDVHLPGGDYYVKVKAGDGTQEKSKFVKIRLNSIARRLEKVMIVTQSGPSITIFELDTALANFATYSTDFRDFDINSYHRQLVITGQQTGPLSVIDIDSRSADYSVPSQSTAYSFFQQTFFTKNNFLLSVKANGQINTYQENGAGTVSVNTGTYLPLCGNEYKDKFCAGYKNLSTGQNYFSMYFSISGTIFYSTPLAFSPEYISDDDLDEIIIAGNNSSTGVIQVFDPVSEQPGNTIYLPGTITDVEKAGPGSWIFVCSNEIVLYNHLTGNVSVIVSGAGSSDIAYNDLSGEIYSAEGNNLRIYSVQNGMLLNSFTFADPVKAVDLLFNK